MRYNELSQEAREKWIQRSAEYNRKNYATLTVRVRKAEFDEITKLKKEKGLSYAEIFRAGVDAVSK